MSPLQQSLIALAFTSTLASALPFSVGNWNGLGNIFEHWGQDLSTPVLPLNECTNTGSTPLPSPTGTLKHIELGLGFQNYTCDGTSGTYIQTVPSAGAIANLYDITSLVNKYTSDTLTKSTLKAFETCLSVTHCTPSADNSYCGSCHAIAASPFQPLQSGLHFFEQISASQTPNFHIWAPEDQYLSAKKSGSATAPASAYDGANNLGAVAWLYLVDNGNGRTHGLKSVYRVETAGGVAPSSCHKAGESVQIPYAAEYWFYD